MTKLAIKEMIRFVAALALSGCHASITPNVKAGAPLPASAAFHVNGLSKVVVTFPMDEPAAPKRSNPYRGPTA